MGHGPIIVIDGPGEPGALDGIPVQERHRELDRICPTCQGRGQWNRELHPHGRSKREPCADCMGEGWIETTGDATAIFDIVRVNGQPQWVTRYAPINNNHLCRTTHCCTRRELVSSIFVD